MKRVFYVSNDLDDLEDTQEELLYNGFTEKQVHVLSNDQHGVVTHHLHPVNVFEKTDVIHGWLRGAILGVLLALFLVMFLSGANVTSEIGWFPVIVLALLTAGFCIWEAGFMGIQKFNMEYRRFEKLLVEGQHVLIVDCLDKEEGHVGEIASHHRSLVPG